jgi:hypothetical protein
MTRFSLMTAACLMTATQLDGSMARAVTLATCGGVCALPLAMTVAPPARPGHLVQFASLAAPDAESALARLAPPRRPADLLTRAPRPAHRVWLEPEAASFAPAPRPARPTAHPDL